MKATIRFKGGPGSGHHGHRGIPGQRGGSLPGVGGDSVATVAVNSKTWYHKTTAEGREGILQEGYRKSHNSIFGSGAYFSDVKPSGDHVMESRVKLNNVLETEYIRFPNIYEEITGKRSFGLSGEEKALIAAGYDGVYVKDEGWLVVFDPEAGVVSTK